jgi:PAS domain S-box-containing protein
MTPAQPTGSIFMTFSKKIPSPAWIRDELKFGDRLIVAAAAFVVYLLIFLIFYSLIPLTFLVLIPVSMCAWLFGPMGGIAAAFLGCAINLFIQLVGGWLDWQTLWISGSITNFPVTLIAGCAIGLLSHQDKNFKQQEKERQESERTQQESIALLNSMVDVCNVGIVITDLEGNINHYNPRFLEIWNFTYASVRHFNFLKNAVQNERIINSYEYENHILSLYDHPEQCRSFEIVLDDARILSCETSPRLQDKEIVGIVLNFLDISNWHQVTDALQKSENNLRLLVNHSREGILLLNEEGNILEWNEAMEQISGMKWEEVFNRPMAEVAFYLLPPNQSKPEALPKLKSLWKEMIQRGEDHLEPGHYETIANQTDGKLSIVEVTVHPIRAETGFLMGVFYRNITDQKYLESSLRKQEKISHSILNGYPDTAALLNTDGRILIANKALLEAAGKTNEDLIGDGIEDFLPPSIHEEVKLVIKTVTTLGKPYYSDSQISGQYMYLTVYPIVGESGKVNLLILFLRNVTESSQRERELEAVASISSALRAAITRAEVYPIILDQIETLMKADGIGLIIKDTLTQKVKVEQARGAWKPLLDMQYSVDQARRAPTMIMEEPYVNNNIEKEQQLFQTEPFSGLKATACVPLSAEGSIYGSLWIGRKAAITKEDMRILAALGNITASATHRAALYENTREYAEQVTNAAEIGRALTETLLLDQIYDRLAHSLLKMLPNICTVMIARYSPENNTFTYDYALHDDKVVEKAEIPYLQRFQPGETTLNDIVRTRKPLVINDLEARSSTRIITLELKGQSGLFAPLVSKGELLGIIQIHSYLKNRFTANDIEMFALIGSTAAIAFQNANLFEDLQKSHNELTEAYESTLNGWVQALDLRDSGTHGHTRRVVELAVALGRNMGLKDNELVHLRRGALLHDIGKMGVPDGILNKIGPLNDEEWVEMRSHTTNAYQWLSPITFLKPALDIPYCHHEKWDGSGYPRGLIAEQIPLTARIFAVVDVWDALGSDRPYRPAWTTEKVVEYLREQRGKHFDPGVVDAFLGMMVGIV